MKLKNYIFQDCYDKRNVYELIFKSWVGSAGGDDGLDVGEIWEIEDSNGNDIEGCYEIIDVFEGDDYVKTTTNRFTGDTFTFIQHRNCDNCLEFYTIEEEVKKPEISYKSKQNSESLQISGTDPCTFSVSAATLSSCSRTGTTITLYGMPSGGPYQFTASNGLTGTSISGESINISGFIAGSYSIVMTDTSGTCAAITKPLTINSLRPPTLSANTVTIPECFDCTETVLQLNYTNFISPLIITVYSGTSSNPNVLIYTTGTTNESTYTLTGNEVPLCNGNFYKFIVTDSFGCTAQVIRSIPSNTSVANNFIATVVDSTCNKGDSIKVSVSTNGENVTYFVSGETQFLSATTTVTSYTFTGLTDGTYQPGIITTELCTGYTNTIEISSVKAIDLSATTVDSVCSQPNGQLLVDVFNSTNIISFPLDIIVTRTSDNEIIEQIIDTTLTSHTINGLFSDTYIVTVTNNNNCSTTKNFVVSGTSNIQASIFGINCSEGNNDGTAEVIVTFSNGDVEYLWSNGETTPSIEGLSGGIYSVTMTDQSGCTLVREVEIICSTKIVEGFVVNTICEDTFETTYNDQQTFEEMVAEVCGTETPIVSGILSITNIEGQSDIITGFTYDSGVIPTNEMWINSVQELLENISEEYDFISTATTINDNSFVIEGVCKEYILSASNVSLVVDIVCLDPTPTNTPTNTLTPTVTPTNTNTPTVTPTNTNTPTVTPTNTNTPTTTPTNTPTPTPTTIYNIHRVVSCCGFSGTFFASIPSGWLIGNTFVATDGTCYSIGVPSIGIANITPVTYQPFNCSGCTGANPCPP
jgi:hypothetical protein